MEEDAPPTELGEKSKQLIKNLTWFNGSIEKMKSGPDQVVTPNGARLLFTMATNTVERMKDVTSETLGQQAKLTAKIEQLVQEKESVVEKKKAYEDARSELSTTSKSLRSELTALKETVKKLEDAREETKQAEQAAKQEHINFEEALALTTVDKEDYEKGSSVVTTSKASLLEGQEKLKKDQDAFQLRLQTESEKLGQREAQIVADMATLQLGDVLQQTQTHSDNIVQHYNAIKRDFKIQKAFRNDAQDRAELLKSLVADAETVQKSTKAAFLQQEGLTAEAEHIAAELAQTRDTAKEWLSSLGVTVRYVNQDRASVQECLAEQKKHTADAEVDRNSAASCLAAQQIATADAEAQRKSTEESLVAQQSATADAEAQRTSARESLAAQQKVAAETQADLESVQASMAAQTRLTKKADEDAKAAQATREAADAIKSDLVKDKSELKAQLDAATKLREDLSTLISGARADQANELKSADARKEAAILEQKAAVDTLSTLTDAMRVDRGNLAKELESAYALKEAATLEQKAAVDTFSTLTDAMRVDRGNLAKELESAYALKEAALIKQQVADEKLATASSQADEAEKSRKASEQLASETESAHAAVALLQSQAEAAQATLDTTQATLDKATKKATRSEKRLEDKVSEYDKNIGEWTTTLETSKAERDDAIEKMHRIEEYVNSLRTEIAELKTTVTASDGTIATLTTQLDEAKQNIAEQKGLAEALQACKFDLSGINKALSELSLVDGHMAPVIDYIKDLRDNMDNEYDTLNARQSEMETQLRTTLGLGSDTNQDLHDIMHTVAVNVEELQDCKQQLETERTNNKALEKRSAQQLQIYKDKLMKSEQGDMTAEGSQKKRKLSKGDSLGEVANPLQVQKQELERQVQALKAQLEGYKPQDAGYPTKPDLSWLERCNAQHAFLTELDVIIEPPLKQSNAFNELSYIIVHTNPRKRLAQILGTPSNAWFCLLSVRKGDSNGQPLEVLDGVCKFDHGRAPDCLQISHQASVDQKLQIIIKMVELT